MNETQVAPAGTGVVDLYRSHGDHFRRVAYLATGSREVAEDLVQEAYLRVQQRWDGLDVPAAYLRVVLVNLCMAWNGRSAMARERIVTARREVIVTGRVAPAVGCGRSGGSSCHWRRRDPFRRAWGSA